MPARPRTTTHLPSSLLHDPSLRHAGELQDRRPPVVSGSDPARPSVHPPRPLHPHHDGLAGDHDKEYRHAAETAHAVPAPYLRLLPRPLSLRALRLLDHLQLHHLRPELRDLLRPPTQKVHGFGRRHILSGSRKEDVSRRESGRGRQGPPEPGVHTRAEEERPRQEQEKEEGQQEKIMLGALCRGASRSAPITPPPENASSSGPSPRRPSLRGDLLL